MVSWAWPCAFSTRQAGNGAFTGMASSLTGGRRAGLFAVGGIVAGGVCHVVAGALGLGLLLQVVPGMLNVMLLADSAYIAWIGGSLMRSTSVFGGLPAIHAPSPW